MKKNLDFIKKSKILIVVFGILLILLVGLVDYFTGYELGLSIVYLMPIFLVVWYTGKNLGIFIAVISTLV